MIIYIYLKIHVAVMVGHDVYLVVLLYMIVMRFLNF